MLEDLTDGLRAEKYVKQFALATRIHADIPLSPEETVKFLNQYNHHNLNWARIYLAQRSEMQPYPEVNHWIDCILNQQSYQAQDDSTFKSTLKSTLLDLAFSTDLIVQVNDNKGHQQTIAIDVTVKTPDIEAKLRKIRGQRPDGNLTKKFNPYSNYPSLRKIFSINKHIVLAMDKEFYPAYATLLNEIYGFANQSSLTTALDLTDKKEVEAAKALVTELEIDRDDPGLMWTTYSEGLTSVSAQLSLDVAKRALEAGHSKEAVLKMLTKDPEYLNYVRQERGNPKLANMYAKAMYSKAEIDMVNKEEVRSAEQTQGFSIGIDEQTL